MGKILDLQKLPTNGPQMRESQSTTSIFCEGDSLDAGLSTCSLACGG